MSTQTQVNSFFTPTQISGCQLWLDAADTQSFSLSGVNNRTVSSWNNKVPGGITTTTVSAPSLSGNLLNNIQTFRFNSSSITASLTTPVGTGDYGLFAVWLTINGGTEGVLSIGPNGGPAAGIGYNGSYYNLYEWGQTESQYVAAKNQYVIQTGTRISSSKTVYYNGNAASSASGALNLTNTGLLIGNGTGFAINGEIGEIIMYQGTLTNSQRQQIEGYLAWKWGLQANLPANHPYKSSPIAPLLSPPTTVPRVLQNPSFVNWSPLQISGCQLWLDAADISTFTLSGSNVLTWIDKSGNGYGATTPSGTITRTATINSVPVITFGNQSYLTISSFVQNFPYYSVFFVMRSTTALVSGNFNFVLWVNTTGMLNTGIVNDTGTYLVISGKSGQFIMRGILGSNPQNQTLMISEVTTGNTATQYINNNGTSLTLTTNVTGTLDAVTSSINVGGMPFSSSTGYDLGEVLVYNNSFTIAQQEQIEGYLAWKWGLSANLPSAHPYKNLAPSISDVPIRPLAQTISASWQPTQISGCQLWLDAADRTTLSFSGNNVTQWRNKTGVGNTYNNNGSITYVNNSVYFPGSSDMTNTSPVNFSTGTTPSMSTFIVFSYVNVTAARGLFQYGQVSCLKTGYVLYVDVDNKVYGTLYCGDLSVNTSVSANVVYILSDVVTYTGTSGSLRREGWLNGSPMSVTNASTTGVNLNLNSISTLGNAAGQPFLGFISEVLYYNQSLSTTQRQNVEGYLAWKWGRQGSLPANHPFKNWPPPP